MSHGGARKNAGRPRGIGPYGEPTKPIRIPISRVNDVRNFLSGNNIIELPLFTAKVAAGLPAAADSQIESYIDINQLLVKNPTSTFMVKAIGESMIGIGIFAGDMMIVDRSLEPISGKIVVASIGGEFTVKRLYCQDQKTLLIPENPDFDPIDISHQHDATIVGVVTNVIHQF